MARQINTRFEGKFGGLVFYKWQEGYYVRRPSSLSRKKVLTHEAFTGTRRSALLLSKASRLASSLYALLPQDQKDRKIYQHLVGQIKLQLKEKTPKEAIIQWFNLNYLGIQTPLKPAKPILRAPSRPSVFAATSFSKFWLRTPNTSSASKPKTSLSLPPPSVYHKPYSPATI